MSFILQAGLKSHAFPLVVDEYEPDTFEAIQHRIKQRFSNGGNKLVKVKLSDPNEVSPVFILLQLIIMIML